MKHEKEKVVVEKATTITWCSFKGLHCSPFFDANDGRVKFSISGNVSEVLAELQENPKIPILDFISRLEAVRSIIFTLKRQRRG